MQIFPRAANLLPLVLGLGAVAAGGGITFVFWYFFSPWNLQVGHAPRQPVQYSHKLHAGELGIDCRYCHANVERSHEAMIPATQTCMGCHALVRADSEKLAVVRESWESDLPIQWVRVHKLPDHVFFDHSVHVAASVGCVSCHGRIDQMEIVVQERPISMSWCLDCHRDPAPNLRPRHEVTNMTWKPQSSEPIAAATVDPPTHCSGCHR
ncbi:MAG: cytochrome c family protein [Proteobacteria bacterium]|nr:cytochrome c family protein [Pseudomonadota bacterium]